jgi:hypothetical protein
MHLEINPTTYLVVYRLARLGWAYLYMRQRLTSSRSHFTGTSSRSFVVGLETLSLVGFPPPLDSHRDESVNYQFNAQRCHTNRNGPTDEIETIMALR